MFNPKGWFAGLKALFTFQWIKASLVFLMVALGSVLLWL